jgi:hypothetical protein
MLSLRELQISFKNSLLDDKADCLDGYFQNNRLKVYRNNIRICLTESLKKIYPTIQKLVGEECFSGLAHKYIAEHPSTTSSLHLFGGYFSDFLSTFPPAQTLPYLPEVAHLEWAIHQVFYEKDSSAFDLSKLGEISEEKYGYLKFQLHPACRLIEFQYPIVDVWKLCQSDDNKAETVSLDSGGEKILVVRRQLEVVVEKLSDGEFALLSSFSRGINFEEACEFALQTNPDFNVEDCLQEHLLSGTITNFSL